MIGHLIGYVSPIGPSVREVLQVAAVLVVIWPWIQPSPLVIVAAVLAASIGIVVDLTDAASWLKWLTFVAFGAVVIWSRVKMESRPQITQR